MIFLPKEKGQPNFDTIRAWAIQIRIFFSIIASITLIAMAIAEAVIIIKTFITLFISIARRGQVKMFGAKIRIIIIITFYYVIMHV